MGFVTNYIRNLGALGIGKEPIRPLLFSYYVTHRCDLACRYCSDGDGKRFKEDPIPELGTAQAKRLLSILREAGDTLDITGGEPLLRFSDVLVLSLDSLDPAPLSRLIGRPVSTAERILRALEFALSRRAATGTRLVIACVATPENLDDVARTLRFANGHRLAFQLSPEIDGTHPNPALFGDARYRALVDEAMAAKRRGPGVLGVVPYLRGIRDFRRFRCHPLLMPVIRPDGRMYYPCLEWKRAEIDLLGAGGYAEALRAARRRGPIPRCRDCCHLFCHMALSLLQTHPLAALGELRHWRN